MSCGSRPCCAGGQRYGLCPGVGRQYAKYSTAYKSGLINAATYSTKPVGKEEVQTYEIGFKSNPNDWMRFNVAGYYTIYDGIQINARDPDTNLTVLQNAASATIYGGEAELIMRPAPRFNVRANLALMHGRFGSFPNAIVQSPLPTGGNAGTFEDASGRRLLRVPDYNASLGLYG